MLYEVITDSLRFFLATSTAPGTDLRYDEEKVKSTWNFVNKLWNASRFTLMNLEGFTKEDYCLENLSISDKWILTKMNNLISKVRNVITSYSIHYTKLYELDDDGDTIVGYKYDNSSCSSDIVIPAEIGGKAITAIGDGAFVKNHDYIIGVYDDDDDLYDILKNADIYKSRFDLDVDYIMVTSNTPDNIRKYCYDDNWEETIKSIDYEISVNDIIQVCYIDYDIWDYISYTRNNFV